MGGGACVCHEVKNLVFVDTLATAGFAGFRAFIYKLLFRRFPRRIFALTAFKQ